MKLYYQWFGKDVDELADIIEVAVTGVKKTGLSTYKMMKKVNLSMQTFDEGNAEKQVNREI